MTEPFASTAEQDLELLRSAAVTAGIIAAGYFRRDLKHWTKEHDSPVSEADIMVDRFLKSSLLAARPDYGWLSEETADNDERLAKRRVFVIDPIDGTRGFIRGEDSWTISLAVVEDNIAVAGVIYAPARNEMYDAFSGGGARVNGERLERRVRADRPAPLIPAPGAVHHELQAEGLDYARGPAYPSLAYRLVQVATGRLDAAVARRGAMDWDVAAAAVILAESGLSFEDVCIGALRFNRPEIRHGALAALGDQSLKAPVHAALIRVYGCPAESQTMERQSP